jgi:hypothetical protein
MRDVDPVYDRSGSKARITAVQHWQPLLPDQQTLARKNKAIGPIARVTP